MPRKRGHRGDGGLTHRPNGRWQAQWSETQGGKRRVRSATFATKSEAEWWLGEARRGNVNDTEQTLEEYLRDWLDSRHGIRPATLTSYRGHVEEHIVPVLGRMRVGQLLPRHVDELVRDRLAFVSPKTGRPLTASTVRSILTTLRMALAAGVRRRQLIDNAAADADAPTVRREPVKAMTATEAAAILDAVGGTWMEQIVRVLLGSGLRLGEATSLNQGDVQDGFVRLRASKTTLRAVPVTDDAMAALREAIAAAPRHGPAEPVFFGPRRERKVGARDRLRGDALTHALPRLLELHGLPRRTPHQLRHGLATLMLTQGTPMRYIAEQLGHSNPAITSALYAHVVPERQSGALRQIDEELRRHR